MPLTDTAIRKAQPGPKPRKLADAKGICLEISPAGGKWWRLKYRIACATSVRSEPCPSGVGRPHWPAWPFGSETASPSIEVLVAMRVDGRPFHFRW